MGIVLRKPTYSDYLDPGGNNPDHLDRHHLVDHLNHPDLLDLLDHLDRPNHPDHLDRPDLVDKGGNHPEKTLPETNKQ